MNFGIADTYEKHYESKLERVKGTTGKAAELNLSSAEIHDIKVQDKNGMIYLYLHFRKMIIQSLTVIMMSIF